LQVSPIDQRATTLRASREARASPCLHRGTKAALAGASEDEREFDENLHRIAKPKDASAAKPAGGAQAGHRL